MAGRGPGGPGAAVGGSAFQAEGRACAEAAWVRSGQHPLGTGEATGFKQGCWARGPLHATEDVAGVLTGDQLPFRAETPS